MTSGSKDASLAYTVTHSIPSTISDTTKQQRKKAVQPTRDGMQQKRANKITTTPPHNNEWITMKNKYCDSLVVKFTNSNLVKSIAREQQENPMALYTRFRVQHKQLKGSHNGCRCNQIQIESQSITTNSTKSISSKMTKHHIILSLQRTYSHSLKYYSLTEKRRLTIKGRILKLEMNTIIIGTKLSILY